MKNMSSVVFAALPLIAGAYTRFSQDPVPSFDSIPKEELYPKGAKFTIEADGSLSLNGQPRYFPATQWYGAIEFAGQPSTNNEAAVKWFYEGLPNYEMVQRLGLDTAGFYGALAWMKRVYRPWYRDEHRDNQLLNRMITDVGLPMYIDMTASEWSHGSLWHADCPLDPERKVDPPKCQKKNPPKDSPFCNHPECGAKLDTPGRLSAKCWTVGHAHWMPYSIMYPQGREIWFNFWTNVAKDAIAISPKDNPPWCYELLNEPAVFDESDYGKELFVQRMKEKYGTIEKLNAAWANSESGKLTFKSFDELPGAFSSVDKPTAYLVEYTKFNEDQFASLLAEGARRIKKIDPNAKVTFQPCTIRTRGMDLYKCYKGLDVVCSQTGGRGIMDAAILRGLADGKPIVDNEMYIGNSLGSIRSSYLSQYMKGFNISYSFKWEGGRSGYYFRNRDNVNLDALVGSRVAKRDVMDVNEFFTPRERGVPRKVAILFSMPTERISECAGLVGYKCFDQAVHVATFNQIPFDVLHEDDLINGSKRLDRYEVLIAAGTLCTYPGSCTAIKDWVNRGGSLVMINTRMALNEYGGQNPEAFTASLANNTREEFGKGKIFVKDAANDEYARFILDACAEKGVTPTCKILSEETGKDASSMEVAVARRNAMNAWIINSCSGGGQLIRFTPAKEYAGEKMIRVWNQIDQVKGKPVLISYRQEVLPDEKGAYPFFARPHDQILLVSGTLAQLRKRYPEASSVRWLQPLAAKTALAEGKKALDEEISKRVVAKPEFTVDPNKCHAVDLRKFVNRRFIDKVPKDGRDGWVDQGAKFSLDDTPWGVVDCNGVPMEFIRYDQNGYRDCLVMKSTKLVDAPAGEMPFPAEVKGIPVDAKAKNIYFLHAIGWGVLGRTETAFTYRFNFEDGSAVEVPCRNFHEVWDWYFIAPTAEMAKARCFRGWSNGMNRGLYIWQWQNPKPDKRVKTIDIISACGQQIPLIVAATVEEP